jgi:hypothetical protein
MPGKHPATGYHAALSRQHDPVGEAGISRMRLQFSVDPPICFVRKACLQRTTGNEIQMTGIHQRVATICHCLSFAFLACANAILAYSATAPDVSFSPATLDFKYLAGSALPAAQNLQLKSTRTALDFTLAVGTVPNYLGQWLSLSTSSGTTPAAGEGLRQSIWTAVGKLFGNDRGDSSESKHDHRYLCGHA